MKTLVLLGDITMDTVVSLQDHPESELDSSSLGHDLTFVGHPVQRVAGTAVLFARALVGTSPHPVLLGAVGDDIAGQIALAVLAEAGVDVSHIHVDPELPTCNPSVVYFARSRFMVRPERHAGKSLKVEMVRGRLTDDLAETTKLCFISGYAIANRDAPVTGTAGYLAAWARDHGIKVILDLVPHNFVDAVGAMPDVERILGALPDVVIAEQRTVAGLLRAQGGDVSDLDGKGAASWLRAQAIDCAIVQYQVDAERYAQDISCGVGDCHDEVRFERDDLLGLGDILAVRALRWAGLLD